MDFLDITFHLVNDIYKPHYKPNNQTLNINKYSNHPPNILKQLPKSIDVKSIDQKVMYSTDQLKYTMMHYMKVTLNKNYNL